MLGQPREGREVWASDAAGAGVRMNGASISYYFTLLG